MPENNENKHVKRKRRVRRRRRPLILTAFIRLFQTIGTLILVAVLTGSLVCCYVAIYVKTAVMPDAVLDMSGYILDENTVIYYYDDAGRPVELAVLSGDENREWVDYEDIPQDLINAFIAIEDKRFWKHDGVDWYRTAGALVNMFLSMQNTFGGSTITQQLVKNVTGNDAGTVQRKVTEIFTALELENTYKKEDILTWYLNKIYLGSNCDGIQTAARTYFGKDVSELSLAECASLAGITNNPSLYSPYAAIETLRHRCANPACRIWTSASDEVCGTCGGTEFGEDELWDAKRWNKARQETILRAMLDPENYGSDGVEGPYITQEEYEAALAEELVFADEIQQPEEGAEQEPAEAAAPTNVHPWYVDAVISEVIADLREEFGWAEDYAREMVYSGGLRIYVPYDPDIQAAVDQIYTDRSNLDYTSKTGQQMSSAITVIDNSTGYVVAMAGDMGEKTGNRLYNKALAPQQPGSSIKPLSVYSVAIEMGLITPNSISDDNPRLYNEGLWPVNVTANWRGLTTIQYAVVQSLNTIAVNVLELVTPEMSLEYLTERYGITTVGSKDTEGYAPFAMGGLSKGISTFEMAAAFATFARNGAFTEATTYLLVEDINGQTLINNKPKTEFVIKESTAYYINSLLTAAVNSGTGYNARIPDMTVAGKTGTTSNMYDLWFAGYTPYYTAAVWTGYPYDEYMDIKGNPSVNLWQKVMAIVHEGLDGSVGFNAPADVKRVVTCMDCGKLATDACRSDIRGNRTATFTLIKSDVPTEECTCHVVVEICTESPILDEKGKETGAYHLATEYCPEECRRLTTMVDYDRVLAEVVKTDEETGEVISVETAKVKDYYALLSIFAAQEDPHCAVHAPEPEPGPEPSEDLPDPDDPEYPGIGDPGTPPADEPVDDPTDGPDEDIDDTIPPTSEVPDINDGAEEEQSGEP